MKTQEKTVGLTKEVGWQFGLRKTFPYSQEYLWDFLFLDIGLKIWLGELDKELGIKKTIKLKRELKDLSEFLHRILISE